MFLIILGKQHKSGDTWGDTDVSGEDASVQAVCNAVWTDAVKAKWQTYLDNLPTQGS